MDRRNIVLVVAMFVLVAQLMSATKVHFFPRYDARMYGKTVAYEIKNYTIPIAGTGAISDIAINNTDLFAVGIRAPEGHGDSFLVKINSSLKEEWYKTWGTPYADSASSLAINNSKIYVIGGYGVSRDWDWNAEILRFNSTGGQEMHVTWGRVAEYSFDYGGYIVVNGSYFYAAVQSSGYINSTSEDDIIILKYSYTGSLLWTSIYPGGESDSIFGMEVEGDYVYICGGTYTNTTEMGDAFLVKIRGDNGHLVWERRWGREYYDFATAMSINNSRIYVAGNTWNNQWDAFLLEYDLDGNLLFQKVWGDPAADEKVTSLAVLNDSIVVVGVSNADPAQDVFITRIYLSDEMYTMSWGGDEHDIFYSVKTNGTTLIACGTATINEESHPIVVWFDMEDSDKDGVADSLEKQIGTSTTSKDTDGDGMPDWYEISFGLNPLANDANNDNDNDGLTNIQEYNYHTSPANRDSDGDDASDGDEVRFGGSPLLPSQASINWLAISYSVIVLGVGIGISVFLFSKYRRRST